MFSIFSFDNFFPETLWLYTRYYFLFPKVYLFYLSRNFPIFNKITCRNAGSLSLLTNPHPPWLNPLRAWAPTLIFLANLYKFVFSSCSFLLTDVIAPSLTTTISNNTMDFLSLKTEQGTIWNSKITFSVSFQNTFSNL